MHFNKDGYEYRAADLGQDEGISLWSPRFVLGHKYLPIHRDHTQAARRERAQSVVIIDAYTEAIVDDFPLKSMFGERECTITANSRARQRLTLCNQLACAERKPMTDRLSDELMAAHGNRNKLEVISWCFLPVGNGTFTVLDTNRLFVAFVPSLVGMQEVQRYLRARVQMYLRQSVVA